MLLMKGAGCSTLQRRNGLIVCRLAFGERDLQGARHPPDLELGLFRLRCATGRLFITPEFAFFEEIEGQINSLQDELDELRERARRAVQVTWSG